MNERLGRRRLLKFAAGSAGVALAAPLRAGAAGFEDGHWRDDARDRIVPWRLRLPTVAGPWPLVLYSHGLGGSRDGGVAWGEAWAGAGIAVLHLQHAGSDVDTARAGLRSLRAAASAEQLRARGADVRFALDELSRRAALGEAPWAAVRLGALGVAGHSFGAHTTQAVAGQRYAGGGAFALDGRPKAFVALSPSGPAPGRGSLQQAFGAITRPFMAVTGSMDGDPLKLATPAKDGLSRAAVYDALPPGQRALLWLQDADHATFGGGRPKGLERGARRARAAETLAREATHRAVVARLTTLWWQAHLLGDAVALRALALPQPGMAPGDRFQLG